MTTTAPSRTVQRSSCGRFVRKENGQVAYLSYRLRTDRLVLTHTHVPLSLERQGFGGSLVRAAANHARRNDLAVVPLCPFAREWLVQHPDVAGRIRIDSPTRAGHERPSA